MSDAPTGRLHRALVETGKAAQVFSFPITGVDGSLHLIGAVVKKGEAVDAVHAELVKIVEGFFQTPPNTEEMDRVRKKVVNSTERILNNHENIGVQLSEYIALGDWRLFFHSRDQAAKVTVEQVNTVAQKYYRRDNRVTGYFFPEDNPQRVDVPAPPNVADVMKDFKGKQTVSDAEARPRATRRRPRWTC